MASSLLLRVLLPILPSTMAAVAVHRWSIVKGLEPPGFAQRERRWSMVLVLAMVFYLGVFSPAAWLGAGPEIDLEAIRIPDLFFLHGVLIMSLLLWFSLGYGKVPGGKRRERDPGLEPEPEPEDHLEPSGLEGPSRAAEAIPSPTYGTPWQELLTQCGLRTAHPGRELAFGLCVGPPLWISVVVLMALLALLLQATGSSELLPQELPPMVGFLAGLPFLVRVALSLSAGVVEEVFFRGFLQRRVGVFFSTLLFVLAHLSYDQPMMLLGITLLSLTFAWLTLVRGNVLPAIAAHFVFDAVQLLWFVPAQMKTIPEPEKGAEVVAVAALWIC